MPVAGREHPLQLFEVARCLFAMLLAVAMTIGQRRRRRPGHTETAIKWHQVR